MRPIYRSFEWFETHYRIVLLVALVLLAALAWQAPKLKFDASADSLVLQGDTSLEYSREIAKRYGSEDFLLVTYEPRGELFSRPVLARMAQLRDELAQVASVSSVTSILDVPLLYSPKVSLNEISDGLPTLADEQVDIALAAQDTIKNFFGSLVIFTDHPFQLGDRILSVTISRFSGATSFDTSPPISSSRS